MNFASVIPSLDYRAQSQDGQWHRDRLLYLAAHVLCRRDGWLLFLGLPGAVEVFRSLNATRRVYVLREQQKSLIKERGNCILPVTATAKTDDTTSAGIAADPARN